MIAKNRIILPFAELVDKSTTYITGYRFEEEVNNWLKSCIDNGFNVGFVCDDKSHNLLFKLDTSEVIPDVDVMRSMQDEQVVVKLNGQKVEIVYNVPEGYYLLVKPFNVFIPLLRIISTGDIQKQ